MEQELFRSVAERLV
jgi:hypothetical protein